MAEVMLHRDARERGSLGKIVAIYIIRCQHGKWYVGRTRRPVARRYREHLGAADAVRPGAAWTRLHPPINLEAIVYGSKFKELEMTLTYMELYGVDNVRGGSYNSIVLSASQITEINSHIACANFALKKSSKPKPTPPSTKSAAITPPSNPLISLPLIAPPQPPTLSSSNPLISLPLTAPPQSPTLSSSNPLISLPLIAPPKPPTLSSSNPLIAPPEPTAPPTIQTLLSAAQAQWNATGLALFK